MRDIDSILKKWIELKKKSKLIEEKLSRYRSAVEKKMLDNSVKELTSGNIIVTKRTNVISRIKKADVPAEIWNKYAVRESFDAYYIKEAR